MTDNQIRVQKAVVVLFIISSLLVAAGGIGMIATAGDFETDWAKRSYAALMFGMYLVTFCWGFELGRWVYWREKGGDGY